MILCILASIFALLDVFVNITGYAYFTYPGVILWTISIICASAWLYYNGKYKPN